MDVYATNHLYQSSRNTLETHWVLTPPGQSFLSHLLDCVSVQQGGNNMISITLRFMMVLAYVLSSTLSYSDDTTDTYNLEKSLRYPGSYDVRTYYTPPYLWQMEFKVDLPYPSEDVLSFYGEQLAPLGWIPLREQGYRIWQTFIDDTRQGSPRIHQLLAKLKKGDMMIHIGIRYYSFQSTDKAVPDNSVQSVNVMIMPFISLHPLENDTESQGNEGVRP
jgi:hypothetical protein